MLKRLALLCLAYYLWYYSQILISSNMKTNNIIIDQLHHSNIFFSINSFLASNPEITKYNLILTSLLIDIGMIFCAIDYLKGNDFRTMILIFVGLFLRQICQYVNRLPIPPNMIWFDPGFPSILVTYSVENDFFFSGHTFIAFTIGLKIIYYQNYFTKLYGLFFMMYEILFIICINGHYFMDIYGAIITYFMLNYFYDKMINRYFTPKKYVRFALN